MRTALSGLARLVAEAPVPITSRAQRFGLHGSNRRAPVSDETLMDTMGSVSTIFSIVTRLSSAEAKTSWHLYRSNPRDPNAEPVEVFDHWALRVWERPNEFSSREQFARQYVLPRELVGNCYWVTEVNPNVMGSLVPIGLWNVRPDRMVPMTHPDIGLVGWTYIDPDGGRWPLAPERVIRQRYPHPYDPFDAVGPVQTILAPAGGMVSAFQYNERFFRNSAIPGGVVQTKEVMTDGEYDLFTEHLAESHQGIVNAFRPLILEGAEWKDAAFSQADMVFPELVNLSRDVMREAFGISKTVLGQSEDVNRATAETAKAVFGELNLVPRLDMVKDALNTHYLPLFGPTTLGMYFDYDDPVDPDPDQVVKDRDSRVSAVTSLQAAGYDPDQLLEAYGLPLVRHTSSQPAPADA